MDSACWVCVCWGHECQDLWVCAMVCMCAKTRPQYTYTLIRKSFGGNGVRTHVNSKGKIPSTGGSEEVQTRKAATGRTVSPTHYRQSYSSSKILWICKERKFSHFLLSAYRNRVWISEFITASQELRSSKQYDTDSDQGKSCSEARA